ncbi:MAG: DUF3502 domain-containing protein [Bacillota bacterium]|nr:DUF3502 domain-containing protein [Bacillota bacterium]
MRKTLIKKISLSILAAAVGFSVFGCNGSSKDNTGPDVSLNSNTDLPPVTLTFFVPGNKPANYENVLQQVEKKSNLNIKLNFTYSSSNNYEYTLSQVMTYSQVDLDSFSDAFYVGRADFYTTADISYLAAAGKLKDITDLFQRYAPNIYKKLSDKELKSIQIGGKLYAVPSLFTKAYTLNVAVKEDLMKKYNLPAINSLDDYELYLKTVKENEKNVLPGEIFYPSASMFAGLYGYVVLDDNQGLVYKKDDPKMTVKAWEQTPEFKQVAGYLIRWCKNGYIDDINYSQGGKLGSVLTKNDGIKEGTRIIQYGRGNSDDFTFYNYVIGKDMPKQRMNPIGGVQDNPAIAINPKSKNAERVLMFLNWVQSSQENYDLFMYGIEGTDYKLEDNQLVSVQNNGNTIPYRYWSSYAFFNFDFYRTEKNANWPNNIDKKEYKDFIDTKTFSAPHEGFSPDYANLQNETKQRGDALLQNIMLAQVRGAVTIDESDLDDVIQALNNSDTEKIVNEVQKQLDNYMKK